MYLFVQILAIPSCDFVSNKTCNIEGDLLLTRFSRVNGPSDTLATSADSLFGWLFFFLFFFLSRTDIVL